MNRRVCVCVWMCVFLLVFAGKDTQP